MKPKRKFVRLPLNDVRRLLQDLECLVVSLDRLGSAFYDDPEKLALESESFLQKVRAFRKLARMRDALWVACDAQLTKTDIDRIEKSLENVTIWRKRKK